MAGYPGLTRDHKTGHYMYRKVVPVELRPRIGKREITKSFGDVGLEQAKAGWLIEEARTVELFRRARGPIELLDVDDGVEIVASWFREDHPEEFDDSDERTAAEALTATVDKWIAKRGFRYSEETIRAIKRELLDNARLIEPPKRKPRPKRVAEVPLTLTEVFASYAKGKTNQKSLDEYGRAVEEFIALHSDLLVTEITVKDVEEFRDAMLEKGLSVVTVRHKKVGAFATVLDHWLKPRRLNNPARGVMTIKRKAIQTANKYLPFSKAQLEAIFGNGYPGREKRPADFWLPLISLYSGARQREIGQLRRDDVFVENGFWFFKIEKSETTSVKSESSERTVPVHSELIRLGFIDYVQTREDRLFPDLTADQYGSITKEFSKRFNRRMASLGFGKRYRFHSFRSLFKDLARDFIPDEEVRDRLMGHESESVGRGYGTGQSVLVRLAKAMNRIKVPVDIVRYLVSRRRKGG